MAFNFAASPAFASPASYSALHHPHPSSHLDSAPHPSHSALPLSPAASDRKHCADPRSLLHSPARSAAAYTAHMATPLGQPSAELSAPQHSPFDAAFHDPSSFHYHRTPAFSSSSSSYHHANSTQQHLDDPYPIGCSDMFAPTDSNSALTPPMSPEADEQHSPYLANAPAVTLDDRDMRRHDSNASSITPYSFADRHDGFRKKNAKIDIPEDRNLNNVDALIDRAKRENNDEELKTLKVQKRLLRNREAALHSRQKKKDHTSRLERDVSHLREVIGSLEQQLNGRNLVADHARQQRQQALMLQNEFEQRTRQMAFEKEKLVRAHKQELDRLHAQIHLLQQGPGHASGSAPMSNVPSSNGFSDSAIGMPDTGDFAGFDFVDVNEACLAPAALSFKAELPAAVNAQASSSGHTTLDAMLMLLMAGSLAAFPSSQPSVSQHLPDSVRAVAPSILETVFRTSDALSGAAPQRHYFDLDQNVAVDDQTRTTIAAMVSPEVVVQFRQLVQRCMQEPTET